MNNIKEDFIELEYIGDFGFGCTKENALKAMDEYAKQECIEFRRFCQAEYKTIMVGLLDNLDKDFDTLAYELYLQSKTK